MTVNVEIVLKGRDFAVTETVIVPEGTQAKWDEENVQEMLVEVLRAIDRAQNPKAPRDRAVSLMGFSWIVEPSDEKSIVAIEIPMGAAVAGPIDIPQPALDALITNVIRNERMKAPTGPTVPWWSDKCKTRARPPGLFSKVVVPCFYPFLTPV